MWRRLHFFLAGSGVRLAFFRMLLRKHWSG
jgi:hypothetical protein